MDDVRHCLGLERMCDEEKRREEGEGFRGRRKVAFFQDGCPEGQENQRVNKEGVCDMNQEVEDVVPGDVEPAVMVINSEGQICEEPSGIIVVYT